MTRPASLILSASLLLAATSAPAVAQTGSLAGTVVDVTDARVPGATVELAGPSGRQTTHTDTSGDFSFSNLAPGRYTLTVSLSGFTDARRTDLAVTNDRLDLPPIVLDIATVADTIVVTASRAEIALVDAPATMSVVNETTIASTPAQNYGDLLRGVPGLNVIQLSARDINLTSRQATSTLSNSQLVLLDGRSLYLDFFGLVLWDFLPNNLGDVKQIEVIRGPASAVWGANALTGVVNVITRSPRESPAIDLSVNGGFFNRNAGSTVDRGAGGVFGSNLTVSRAINDRWAYRASAGYFASSPLPRPTGRIPVVPDPRSLGATVGGAPYPADTTGPIGTAFQNRGTSQPKVDFRLDQDLAGTRGSLTYQAGFAGSEGIVYTGLGPFDMQPGSFMGYGKVNYRRNGFRLNAFSNLVDAEAPNLLLTDPATSRPLQLNFSTQTYDVEAGHVFTVGSHQVLNVGGNVRRNNFSLTIAPNARNRTELGGYIEDSILFSRVRITAGARVDKFGNLSDPVFSPRLSLTLKPHEDHAVRLSVNRAFRSPSVVNNYIDTSIVNPTDLSGLAPLLPEALRPLVATPFPLVVRAVGSELPVGSLEQTPLRQEKLTAYEVAYTATFRERTTATAAFYVNDLDDSINFSQLPATLDPYTAATPPPGWRLPPAVLTLMAARGILLPRTAFTYLNLGPLRQKGLELSLDHRVRTGLSMFANYSWQSDPTILDDPAPYPALELALPPTHRFNAGVNTDSRRFLGSLSVNYTDRAFWSDVLTSAYHGYTDAYTLVNGSFGVKWQRHLTTVVKVTNLLNQEVQQHVFGDLLKQNVSFEARLRF
ncbi:MAG: TonB-dependent receptor [Vicinamibacterales bacterium]